MPRPPAPRPPRAPIDRAMAAADRTASRTGTGWRRRAHLASPRRRSSDRSRRLGHALSPMDSRVETIRLDESGMRSGFFDAAVLQDDDAIGVRECRETM